MLGLVSRKYGVASLACANERKLRYSRLQLPDVLAVVE
jgi:hypothetical protein